MSFHARHHATSAGWLLALLITTPTSCGGEDTGPPPEPYVRPVRTVVVEAADAARERSFSGISRSGSESKLSFKVSGTVRKVHVKVGSKVAPDMLIAELDPSDYELQVQEARAAVAQASAASRNAKASYKRMRGLYEANSISRAELDAARAQASSTGAGVAAASKRVEFLRSQLGYTKLVAQVAGSVSAVAIEENENVAAGSPVVVVASGGQPEVAVGVPENVIAMVHKDATAKVTFDAVPDRTFDATVTEVGVALDPDLATYPVVLKLGAADDAVRAGMAANVRFSFPSAATTDGPRFLVPPAAVAEDRKGRFVYIVEPGDGALGVAKRHEVTTGALTANGLEVTSGLKPGDLLVTAGVSKITDGQNVKLPIAARRTDAGTSGTAADAAP